MMSANSNLLTGTDGLCPYTQARICDHTSLGNYGTVRTDEMETECDTDHVTGSNSGILSMLQTIQRIHVQESSIQVGRFNISHPLHLQSTS